jgi:anti-sigma regulatory factor (Ser/Thr protein kinase)
VTYIPDRARCRMEQAFQRNFDSLEEIFAFTESFFDRESIGAGHRHDANFAIEELFTNMVKYNRIGKSEICLSLTHAGDKLLVSLTDPESEPFDVTKVPPVDIQRPIHEREPGGLGIHLTRKVVDSIDYLHRDGCTTITFSKNLR